MTWVTREKARVEPIACPWLIRKFIDPEAEFRYVPADQVLQVAEREGAIPFDTPGAERHHYEEGGQEYVSFDARIRKYRLGDPALLALGRIVRVADGGSGPAPEAAGLEAAATGFRLIAHDDFENQRLPFPLYDALYAYCRGKLPDGRRRDTPGRVSS